MIDVPAPEKMDAANENVAMAIGQAAFAYPEQDHLGHLQAHLDFLPPGKRVEWTAMSYGGNLFGLAAAIISQGGHISIGLGDHPYNELGMPTNADLIRRIVSIAKECGREIALTLAMREIRGLESEIQFPLFRADRRWLRHLIEGTALAIVAHEVPQEGGDFLILLHSGYSKSHAFTLNLLSSAAMVVGGVLGYYALHAMEQWIGTLISLAAASMLYVAVADLIPGLHRRPEIRAWPIA